VRGCEQLQVPQPTDRAALLICLDDAHAKSRLMQPQLSQSGHIRAPAIAHRRPEVRDDSHAGLLQIHRPALANFGYTCVVNSASPAPEIIFLVEEAPEGGFTARALGASIFTEADDLESLHANVRDAVSCHFEAKDRPTLIRLHHVKEEVLAP
jgi:hypothetical protein